MRDRKMEERQTGTTPIFLSAIFLSKPGQGMSGSYASNFDQGRRGSQPYQPCPDLRHLFQFPDTLRGKCLPHRIEWLNLAIEWLRK